MRHISLVSILFGITMLASACGHSGGATSAAKAIDPTAIPSDLTLNPAPSKPLTTDQYKQFQAFLTLQDSILRFSPQDYVFTDTDRSSLPPQDQTLLGQIQSQCLTADVPTKSGQPAVGSTVTTTDARTVSGANCPVSYSRNLGTSMRIDAVDQNTQSAAADGEISVNESMYAETDVAAGDMSERSSDSKTNVTFALQAQQSNVRLYMKLNTDQQLIEDPFESTDNGYTSNAKSEMLVNVQNGSPTFKLAMNLTLMPAGMTTPVVVSLLAVSDGSTPTVQAHVNGVAETGNDLAALMSSPFIQAQVVGALNSTNLISGDNSQSNAVNNAVHAVKVLVRK